MKYFNSLDSSEFPADIFRFKEGTSVILLKNVNPPKMCNVTRLQITVLKKLFIEIIIFTGCDRGESVFIFKIPLIPSGYFLISLYIGLGF